MRRLPSTDGVEVAVYDFGGEGAALLLVHPTSFLAAALAPLAGELNGHFHCWGADLRGHGLTSSPDGLAYVWSGFAEDVLAAVDGLGLDGPFAVGHSSGGASVLLAEAERPGTFRALWCYEPIVWPDPERARARAERLAEGARRRRDRFPSRVEAYENFMSKPPFSTLSESALRAYLEHGFADQEDGSVTLRCRREVEAEIYSRAVEGDRFARLAEVECPVTVACGGATDAIRPNVAEQQVAALPHARLVVFDGLGHFGPLEDPPRVAAAIRRDLAPA
ncbi:MAG: alpha/beta hydrolase [Actinomycetota bacterium]|nr:alpha/beta hydrolase [Actinomycetota bacterium]